MKKLLLAGCAISIAVLAACAGNSNADSSSERKGEQVLKCLDITGQNRVEYKGYGRTIMWYGDGTYVEVKLADKTVSIPQHRCELTEYK